MSAQFPILSPAGVIRAKAEPGFGDRVVDGGYFEDAGLTTALDVAKALKAQGVNPFILWVSNEPVTPPGPQVVPPRADASPSVTPNQDGYLARVFGLAAAPFETLISTRSGHEYEEADLVDRDLHQMNGNPCLPDYQTEASFYQIGVHADPDLKPPSDEFKHRDCNTAAEQPPAGYLSDPNLILHVRSSPRAFGQGNFSMTKVSMSWWLAAAVQADLDAQLCDRSNRTTIRDLMGRLRR